MITLEMPTRIRELRERYLTVAEYHALGEDGTLGPDDRVELIRGRLVVKAAKTPAHIWTAARFNRVIAKLLDDCWLAVVGCPIALSDSEPEPDFAIVRISALWKRPSPADCGLVIEVSDSSPRDDRTTMYELYAEAGIPIYWIVNIPDRQVEVYEMAAESEYKRKTVYRDGQSVPFVLAGTEVGAIPVSAILPDAETA